MSEGIVQPSCSPRNTATTLNDYANYIDVSALLPRFIHRRRLKRRRGGGEREGPRCKVTQSLMPKSEVRDVRTGHLKARLLLIRTKDGCILGISALPMLQGIVYSHFPERKMSGHLLLQGGLRLSFRRSGVKLL